MNIIFKILHVSLDKKSLFSVIALCLVKLLPVLPHSYYIGYIIWLSGSTKV